MEGETINLAGNKGAGFIGRAEELRSLTTSEAIKKAMAVPYNPDYILEFQLKDITGLQNFIKYDDPLFRVGGKTISGYFEYNMPGLTSDNIINWYLRELTK
jgi:hypothetical protein